MIRLILATLLALPVTGSHAEILTPADFTLQRTIERPADADLISIRLSGDVYRALRRNDLGDLRIVNAAGAPLPMALYMPPSSATTASAPPPVRETRALLPLPGRRDADNTTVIRGQAGQAAVTVELPADSRTAQSAGYLIEVGSDKPPLQAVELTWTGMPQFEAALRVRVSDDLRTWRTVAQRATLTALGQGDERVILRRIELDGVKARYLRLEWLDHPPEALTVDQATLSFTAADERLQGIAHEWVELSGERDGDTVHYVSPGLFPVDLLALVPADGADVLHAAIDSRPTPRARWSYRAITQVYRLHQAGKQVESKPTSIATTRDPLWKVQLLGGTRSGTPPTLRLGWQPETVVFVARGAGPFRLLAGNAAIQPAWLPAASVIPGYGSRNMIAPREGVLLPGDSTPVEIARDRSPWQQPSYWLLWAVLVAGVFLLGWMARTLWRDMSDRDRP